MNNNYVALNDFFIPVKHPFHRIYKKEYIFVPVFYNLKITNPKSKSK